MKAGAALYLLHPGTAELDAEGIHHPNRAVAVLPPEQRHYQAQEMAFLEGSHRQNHGADGLALG